VQQAALERKLSAVLSRIEPGFERLIGADRLTGGASQETWRLAMATVAGEKALCLRRSSAVAGDMEGNNLSPSQEAVLIKAAARAGVPEPGVVHVLEQGDDLGEGFLMEWLSGETLGGRITHSRRFERVRPALARQCGEILGRIHSIDVPGLGLALPYASPAELVEATWQQYREFHTPQPMLDFTARWLLENPPPESPDTLVHGDFRNGNLMVDEDRGVIGVLDWELACVGDPVRDLGWACVNSWRFGSAALPVGGFGRVEDLLDGYRAVTGREVDPVHLNFWVVFGSFWWSVVCLRMAESYRSGENPSVERPAIGRRASEGQADCVAMLIPGPVPELPESPPPGDDLPSVGELADSVAAFLGGQAAAELTGANAYLARVAANALGILRRQWELGPSLEQAERGRLVSLLGRDESLRELRWRLVDMLRGGMSLVTPGLSEHLRQTVLGQLAIDQPTYAVTPGLPLART
jgi:aminoglycoside phosphotransferase (APT) family kinase protein